MARKSLTPLSGETEDRPAPKLGLLLLQGLILLVFFTFALRFWYLQILRGEEFARLARENQTRKEALYAPRGLLRDRDDELLAVNQPAYALALVREEAKDLDATLAQVAQWTGENETDLRERFTKGRRRVKPFEPLILVPDLSFEQLAVIEAASLDWPGLTIVIRPRRFYPQANLLAHILGYVAEANEEELNADAALALGDNVGKQGLELVLESSLRGAKGRKQMEVDATGRRLQERILTAPKAGQNLNLSIDLDLQEIAAEQLKDDAGAAVVLDPDTGQVLALVTSPAYDNNAFARGLSTKEWETLRDNPRHPLQNRVIQSTYPPGSIWKLLMAGAGLYYGVIDPSETIFCPGSYKLGKRVFRCWRKQGHGHVDMRAALIQSCDVYFYKLGERLGVDRIAEFAFACGFGEQTEISLPHERSGLVPTREWKKKRFGEPWQGGETLNISIGQGFVLVHPLQVARFIGALYNGGWLMKPNLLRDEAPVLQGRLPLTDEQRELLLTSMVQTVESDRGTARRIYHEGARIGGKTGTAQVVKLKLKNGDERRTLEEMPYEERDHAWLASFGEKYGRAYVVVVMVEHGGHGGSTAGPLVKAIYDYLFDDARFPAPPELPEEVDPGLNAGVPAVPPAQTGEEGRG